MFTAIAINVKEDDPSFKRLKETKDALARINIMGKENYQMERSYNVLDSAAENEGGVIGAAVGIGASVGVGAQIGNMVRDNLNTNPSTPPPLTLPQYFLGINGQQQGPFDYEAVKTAIQSHQIDESVLVWKRGMANWCPIGDMSDFSEIFNNCPPPLPPM